MAQMGNGIARRRVDDCLCHGPRDPDRPRRLCVATRLATDALWQYKDVHGVNECDAKKESAISSGTNYDVSRKQLTQTAQGPLQAKYKLNTR